MDESCGTKGDSKADESAASAESNHGHMSMLQVAVHDVDEAQHDNAYKVVEESVQGDNDGGPSPVLRELARSAIEYAGDDPDGEWDNRRDEMAFRLRNRLAFGQTQDYSAYLCDTVISLRPEREDEVA